MRFSKNFWPIFVFAITIGTILALAILKSEENKKIESKKIQDELQNNSLVLGTLNTEETACFVVNGKEVFYHAPCQITLNTLLSEGEKHIFKYPKLVHKNTEGKSAITTNNFRVLFDLPLAPGRKAPSLTKDEIKKFREDLDIKL
jgi:hypothetical protein